MKREILHQGTMYTMISLLVLLAIPFLRILA